MTLPGHDGGRPVVAADLLRVRWPLEPALRGDRRAVAYTVSGLDAESDALTYDVHLVTLDTHYPYYPRTPADQVCTGAGASLPPGICLYRNLFGATMQTVGEQVAAAKVKPDVIYIYGDHAPPYLNERLRGWFSRKDVPVYVLRRRPASSGVGS